MNIVTINKILCLFLVVIFVNSVALPGEQLKLDLFEYANALKYSPGLFPSHTYPNFLNQYGPPQEHKVPVFLPNVLSAPAHPRAIITGQQFNGSVSGIIYNDTDANGIRDTGEQGIANVTISLYSSGSNYYFSTVNSLANGSYSFSNVPPGKSYLYTSVPNGNFVTQPSTGSTYILTVVNGATITGINFGLASIAKFGGTISGTVYNDTDTNHIRDAGEQGIANATISYFSFNGAGASGFFHLNSTADGSFVISKVPPGPGYLSVSKPGYFITQPKDDFSYSPDVPIKGNLTAQNFGLAQLSVFGGSINGTKFLDKNGTGIRSAGDPGIPGVPIYLYDSAGSHSTVTDLNGNYNFSLVGPGPLTLNLSEPPGYYPTQPRTFSANLNGSSVVPPTNVNELGSGFFIYDLPTKMLQYFVYINNDTTATAHIYNGTNGTNGQKVFDLASFVQHGSGSQSFDISKGKIGPLSGPQQHDILNGNWYLQVTNSTFPNGEARGQLELSTSDTEYDLTLNNTQHLTGIDFGDGLLNVTRHLNILKFLDSDGNGIRESNEQGLGNWTFTVTDANNQTFATLKTNSTGQASLIPNLSAHPLPYTIAEQLQPGWVNTTSTVRTIITPDDLNDVEFGNSAPASISGTVFDDADSNGLLDTGESGISGVNVTLSGDTPPYHYEIVTTNSNGVYNFTSIPPGTYQVYADYQNAQLTSASNYYNTITVVPHQSAHYNIGFAVPTTLLLNIVDSHGNSVPCTSVTFRDAQTGTFITDSYVCPNNTYAVSGFTPGQKVTVDVSAPNELLQNLVQNVTLANQTNKLNLSLQAAAFGTISGNVTYNGTPLAFTPVYVHPSNAADQDTYTNVNGSYQLTVPTGNATVIASGGTVFVNDQNIPTESQNGTVTIKTGQNTNLNLALQKIKQGYVQINLFTQYAGNPVQGPLPIDWRVLVHYAAQINTPTGPLSSWDVSNPVAVNANPGDTISVCLNGAQANLPSACQSTVLDKNDNGTVNITLAQPGIATASLVDGNSNPVQSWNAVLYKTDSNGTRTFVTTYENNTNALSISPADAGSYLLEISSPDSSGNEIKATTTFSVGAGQINNLGTITLQRQSVFLGESNTLSAEPPQTPPGGMLNVRAQFSNDAAVNNTSLILDIPDKTTLVNGSVTLNGKQASGTFNGTGFKLGLGNLPSGSTGKVEYQLMVIPSNNATALDLGAEVTFVKNGQTSTESLGHVTIPIQQITLTAPSTVGLANFTVSGRAPPNNQVQLFDEIGLIGTTKSSSGGFWRLDAGFPSSENLTLHTLYAKVQTTNANIVSNNIQILHDITAPEIINLCMEQTNGRHVCFDPRNGLAEFPYVYVPGYDFNFGVYFDKPNTVTNVKVIMEGNPNIIANATLGSDNVYHATMSPYYLGPVSVQYAVKHKPYNEALNPLLPLSNTEKAQLRSILPPGLANATATVTNSTAGNTQSSIKFANGGTLNETDSIVPNLTYTPTQNDLDLAAATGMNIYNFSINTVTLPDGGVHMVVSYFVPYSELPSNLVGQLQTLQEPVGRILDTPIARQESNGISGAARSATIDASGLALHEGTEVAEHLLSHGGEAAGGTAGLLVGTQTVVLGQVINFALTEKEILELQECAKGLSVEEQNTINHLHAANAANTMGGMLAGLIILGVASGGTAFVGLLVVGAINFTVDHYYIDGNIDEIRAKHCIHHILEPHGIVDPSGNVYEAVPSNPLQNVTSTITVQNTTSKLFSAWDATGFGQINPELTDSNGHFGWDVPVGNWQVVFDKTGYKETKTQVYAVPPPRTGILVSMVSLLPPTVTAISAVAPSTVDVQFSKYVLASGLTNSTITVTGQTGKVTPVNAVQNVNGTSLTREAQFTPTKSLVVGTSYTVHVSSLISSYAGIPLSSNVVKTVTATSSPTYTDTVSSNGIQGTTFVIGKTLSATTATTDPLSTMTTFGWQSPTGQLVQKVSVNSTSGNSVSTFTPTSTGSWQVIANFTDGNNLFHTTSTPFTVAQTVSSIPQVTSLTGIPALVTKSNINSNFTLYVAFNQAMNKTKTPTISFAPSLSAIFPSSTGSFNTQGTVYTAKYLVHNVTAITRNVNVTVSGAVNGNGTINPVTFANFFSIDTQDKAYNAALLDVYNSRADLKSAFPEVQLGNYKNLYSWASLFGEHENPAKLGPYIAAYDLMVAYDLRSDLQSAFPEAGNGSNIIKLENWAANFGVHEMPSILGPHQAIYDLMFVYNQRPDLKSAFPGADEIQGTGPLISWAANFGVNENSAWLGTIPNKAVFALMSVYNARSDLQSAFPEAANSGDIKSLLDWAHQYGETENAATLGTTSNKAVYDVMFVYNNIRSDVKSAFPEAKNLGDLHGLFSWAANFGIHDSTTSAGNVLGPDAGYYGTNAKY